MTGAKRLSHGDAGHRTGTAPVGQQGIAITILPHALAHQAFDLCAPVFGRQVRQYLRDGCVVIPHSLIWQRL
ncbi:hypothetical protein D9M68_926960 [compost metagenome]